MSIELSHQFNFGKLLRYALPSMVMMVCLSLYTIVDGYFVSSLIGSNALSAVNLTFPLISFLYGISLMFATGGSAIIGAAIGNGETDKANRLLSFIVITDLVVSILIAALFYAFADPLLRLLGADEQLLPLCKDYARTMLLFVPAFCFQLLFESFFVTASRPKIGLYCVIAGGILNIVLDYVLIRFTPLGIAGAAIATGIAASMPMIGGLLFFGLRKKGLRFGKPKFYRGVLGRATYNGSSEMVTNLANCVNTILFNLFMMRMLGAKGVAAISVILYAQFLLSSLFMGYSIGVAPVLSYNFGAQQPVQLKKITRHCYVFIGLSSLVVAAIAIGCASPIAKIFSNNDAELQALISRGLSIFSVGFLLMGFNIFSSGMFTAISDGLSSAVISFSRTLVFTVIFICCLPLAWREDGLWAAVPFAELCACFVSVLFLKLRLPKRYKLMSPAMQAGNPPQTAEQ